MVLDRGMLNGVGDRLRTGNPDVKDSLLGKPSFTRRFANQLPSHGQAGWLGNQTEGLDNRMGSPAHRSAL